MYVLLDLHAIYTHILQVSSVAFGMTPPVLHFNNIIWIHPSKICFPYILSWMQKSTVTSVHLGNHAKSNTMGIYIDVVPLKSAKILLSSLS